MESCSIGAGHLEAERLRPVFPAQPALAVRAHFIVYPERHAEQPEVAQFIAWMAAQAA